MYSGIQQVEVIKDKTTAPHPDNHHYQPIVIEFIFPAGVDKEQITHFVNNNVAPSLRYRPSMRQHVYLPADAPLEYVIDKHASDQYTAHIKALGIPRHPVQLYETFVYLFILGVLIVWWRRKGSQLRDGMLAGMAMILCYTARFFLEFFKEPFNVVLPSAIPITMGHILSLVTVVGGAALVVVSYCVDKRKRTFPASI